MPEPTMQATAADQVPTSKIWLVILASAVGTMIEWYDFYIFGSLTAILALKFYPPGHDMFAYIAYLATFAVGFVVRPFGALFFGRIGDLVGRKYAFLVTLSIMGGATALIGALPTFKTAGWFAPIILILIRILQGLALGGEYGGAAVYVAEHVPDNRRGFYTSFIQITATLGLFVSILVILGTQASMTKEDFSEWGWRIPFLVSAILVAISLYIRMKMEESPIFASIKSAGMSSAQPLKDAFTHWPNMKQVLISLFGATAGQGVVWYTGQFFALFYMQTVLKINPKTANYIIVWALLFGMPFFTIFGALSDKIGRKWIMMLGCLLAVVSYIPIYHAMHDAAGNNVTTFTSATAKATGATTLTAMTVDEAGKTVPAKEAANPDTKKLIFLIWIQMIWVCMVYGPIAAYLVEAFPAKIRYTSLSLPYHIGNGVFGGLLPLIGIWVSAATGNIYAGLWYPMGIAGLTFIVGSLMLRDTRGVKIWHEVGIAAKK
ncbi:MAG TPA: MFS transporter [Candidatus Limnocylindrales bacterium]|nr:MFS transporter [Candidatus Limnocylindrales bacterium]